MTSPAAAAVQASLKVRPLSGTVAAEAEPASMKVGTSTHAASSVTRKRLEKGTKKPPVRDRFWCGRDTRAGAVSGTRGTTWVWRSATRESPAGPLPQRVEVATL